MRLLWSRRAHAADGKGDGGSLVERDLSERKPRWSWRAFLPTRHESPPEHGPWLRLARDYLLAQNANLRTAGTSGIEAALPDGNQLTYTDAPESAQDSAFLLVPGSAAATQLVADIEARSRFGALHLAAANDALDLAARFTAPRADKKRQSTAEVSNSSRAPGHHRGLTLHWEKPPTRAVVSRTWEHASVEIEYRVGGRDHFGRIADTVRVGVDPADGATRPPLDLSLAINAQSVPLTSTDRDTLKAVIGLADERLRPDLEAAASFLRLRSEAEYRRRIETARGVAERARREQPDEARETEQALKREIAALAAVFAVEVECSVVAAWVLHSPMADVAYQLPNGSTVEVALDLGRATAEPLSCAACRRTTREATICAHAHILCLACRERVTDACAVCVGAMPIQPARGNRKDSATGLTLEGLTRLGPAMWRACVGWLLEQQRYNLSKLTSDETEARWRGMDADGQDIFIRALRGDSSHVIAEPDVAATARLAHKQGLERALLLSAGSPTHAAREAAKASNIRFIDGEALRAQLAVLAESADHHQEATQAEMRARAKAALSAHVALQKALTTAAKRMQPASAKQRAVSGATLARAREQLRVARTSAEQAFLAWETLLTDWLGAFGTAPAHDGSLPLLVDASEYQALRERAAHLGTALASVAREIAATPSDGGMGYGAWRAAVIEEARLRCAALAAKLEMIDPAQWAEFDAARPPTREADAIAAETAARHASARADKAQSQVTQLVG